MSKTKKGEYEARDRCLSNKIMYEISIGVIRLMEKIRYSQNLLDGLE
jgi:hypothetical protein